MQSDRETRRSTPTALLVALNDFDHLSSFFSSWQGRFEQLSTGTFRGTLRVVQTGMLRAVAVDFNQSILLRGRDTAGLCSVYPVDVHNAGCVWQRQRLSPGQLVVHGPDTESDHCSARQSKSMGLSLNGVELDKAANVLLNTNVAATPRTWAALSVQPEANNAFTRDLRLLISRATTDPTLLLTAEGHRLEQECVRSLVAMLAPETTIRECLSLAGRADLVRRAEEFMRAHLGDPIGAIDMCNELQVSDRTLRLAFQKKYHLGPMTYYRCLRLNAVRSRLKANQVQSIAALAQEFGFHHLGNFAGDYRRLFGEKPSQTLHYRRGASALLHA